MLEQELVRRMVAEQQRARDFKVPLVFDLSSLLCLVANLQLALRHPGNTGAAKQLARATIDGIIERVSEAGFSATAELMKLGDDPQHDTRPPERPPCCAHCGAEIHSKEEAEKHQCNLIELGHYPD